MLEAYQLHISWNLDSRQHSENLYLLRDAIEISDEIMNTVRGLDNRAMLMCQF